MHIIRCFVPRSAAQLIAAVVVAAPLSGCHAQLGIGPEHTLTDTLHPTGTVRTIRISSGSGDIRVAAGDQVDVRRTVRYNGDSPGSLTGPSDGRLVLDNCGDCSTDYTVTAPAGTVLDLHSGSGLISVAGFATQVTAESGSGAITSRQVTGPVKLTAESGSIDADGLCAPAEFTTGSGHIHAGFFRAVDSVTATAGSGDVRLTLPSGPYHVTVNTGSGGRTIEVPQNDGAPNRVRVNTNSGDVSVLRG